MHQTKPKLTSVSTFASTEKVIHSSHISIEENINLRNEQFFNLDTMSNTNSNAKRNRK
jgi:hypothetical protein